MPGSLALVTILAPDYDAAIAWFADMLGFCLAEDTPLGGGKRWVVLAPPRGHGARLLIAQPGNAGQSSRVGDQTGGRVGFFLSSDDFAGDYAAMRAKGVRFLEEPRYEPYGAVAQFEDCVGNRWDLVEYGASASARAGAPQAVRGRQLPLDLPYAPSFADEDFLTSPCNRDALRAVALWPDWAGKMLLLIGPNGAGKSHLGAIWARKSRALALDAASLNAERASALAAAPALLIDNADAPQTNEAALFHALNIAAQADICVLLTAHKPPDLWELKTPDLLSRLRLAPAVLIGEPDDELTHAVLFKLFNDRQLRVEPAVIRYIAPRIERSLDAARRIVEAIDREALARGRAVSRAIASEVLKTMDGGAS